MEAIPAGPQGEQCIRLFVAGERTHSGKTSVCLSILGSLLNAGMLPQHIGYIKAATQCTKPDLLSLWCEEQGIAHVDGVRCPLVFVKGFTRAFLEHKLGSSEDLLQGVVDAVTTLSKGKSFVLVDGVGFPAVGTVVGVSNCDVARALRTPVLLVGASGVGGAIDSYALNSHWFRSQQVRVLGCVLNRAPLSGFYAADKVRPFIDAFLGERHPLEKCFGVVPTHPSLDGAREQVATTDAVQNLKLAADLISHFAAHTDLLSLLRAVTSDQERAGRSGVQTMDPKRRKQEHRSSASSSSPSSSASPSSSSSTPLTQADREEVVRKALATQGEEEGGG